MCPIEPPRARKTIGVRPDSDAASHICMLDPNDSQVYKAKLLAQPCGSRRAHANWCRDVTPIQFTAKNIYGLVTSPYAEDVFSF